MALPLANTFEGGSNGTSISSANSGGTSGDAFDIIQGTGTNAPKFSTAFAAHGTMSMICGSGGQSRVAWSTAFGSPTEAWVRIYFYVPSPGVTSNSIGYTFVDSAGTNVGTVFLRTDETYQIRATATTGAPAGVVSTSTFTLDTWFRIELHLLLSGGNFTLDSRFYASMDSTTITESLTQGPTSAGTATSIASARFGWASNAGVNVYVDDVAGSGTAWVGPVGGAGTAYTDADTATAAATCSGTEGRTSADSAISAQVTDLASSTETATFVDSAVSAQVTDLASSTETRVVSDLNTASASVLASATEVYGKLYTDTATAQATSTASGADQAVFADANTILPTLTPSATEVRTISDANTAQSQIAASATEVYTPGGTVYTDSQTVAASVLSSATETRTEADVATALPFLTPSAAEVFTGATAYVDSATVLPTSTPSAAEVRTISDAATVLPLATLSAVESDVRQYVDAATAASTISPTAVEIAAYIEAFIASSLATPAAVEVPPGGTDYSESDLTAYTSTRVAGYIETPPGALGTFHVKDTAGSGTGSANITVAVTSTTGNTLVALVVMATNTANHVNSISDTALNTWTLIGSSTAPVGASRIEAWIALGAASISSITVHMSSGIAMGVSISEWANVSGVDSFISTGGSGTPATVLTAGPITIGSGVGALVAGVSWQTAGSTITAGPTNGFSAMSGSTATNQSIAAGYLIPGGAGTYSTEWDTTTPTTNQAWGGIIVALSGSPGSGVAYFDPSTVVAQLSTPSAVSVKTSEEAATAIQLSAISALELPIYFESATILAKNLASALEIPPLIDAAEVDWGVTASALDVNISGIQEVGTALSEIDAAATEIPLYRDSATLFQTVIPSAQELGPLIDAATAFSLITASSTEQIIYVDSNTAAEQVIVVGAILIEKVIDYYLVGVAYSRWSAVAYQHWVAVAEPRHWVATARRRWATVFRGRGFYTGG